MAKSRKNKSSKRRREVFYESVPATLATPPSTLVEVKTHLAEQTEVLREYYQSLMTKAHSVNWNQLVSLSPAKRKQVTAFLELIWAYCQKAPGFIRVNATWAGKEALAAAHQLALRAQYAMASTQAATAYARPLADDIAAFGRRYRQRFFGRRARSIYLSLLAGGALAVVMISTATAVTTISSYANDISSPAALLSKKKTGTTILDRHGLVLFEGYGGQATKVIPLNELPANLKNATLAAEDPGFYQHPGFSWRGTVRAAWVDVTHRGTIQGGSTLTQQLVKNALLTSDRNFQRKFQELLLATELERRYTKDQIFEMYLNEIYYGQGSSGVEAASQTYFHKPAGDLSLGESAMLAGLPLGPSRFDPNRDLAAATGRRDFVLGRMQTLGKITAEQADAAKAQPLVLAGSTQHAGNNPLVIHPKRVNIQAPHFVFYVLDQLRQQYGDEMVEQGGITVTTTLDLTKQHAAEDAMTKHVAELSSHHVTNGGLISLEQSTGDILAMVGSVDYNAPEFGNVNVTLSDLQPGSSFKPIAYATAFKKGWNGATTIDDTPFAAPGGNGTMYVPVNYDGKFRGKVTLRRALANSLNIPAIKVLQFAGIPDTLQTAHDLGITTLNTPDRYGLSLVLGGGEVRPIDMATVYATLANSGARVEPQAILKVAARNGKDITKASPKAPRQVLDPRIAYMLTNILSDNNARTEEFGPNSPLKLSRPNAAKTGTTNDFRDNWTVGYTPQITTAVWVGNNDHSPMENVDGITGAAPIWHDYMEAASQSLPALAFTPPAGIVTAHICADGGLANAWNAGYDEVYLAGSQPTRPCSSFSIPNFFGKNNDKPDKQQNDQPAAPQQTPDAPATPTDQVPPTTVPDPIKVPKTPRPLPFN